MKAKEAIITVLDFETTGSVRGYPVEPWQLGMVCLDHGQLSIESPFNHLLRVGDRPFNAHAPGKHHELRSELENAQTLNELWPEITPWIIGRPLAAHNIGTEKKFIRKLAPFHKTGPWIDTLKLARLVWPELPSHGLGFLMDHLHLSEKADELCPGLSVHDAFYDAVGCALLLQHLLDQPGWNNLEIHALSKAKPDHYHKLRQRLRRGVE